MNMIIKNTAPMSVLKSPIDIIVGDRIFHPLLSEYFVPVTKITQCPKAGRTEFTFFVQIPNPRSVAFFHVDAETKVQTAGRFSNNS